MVIFGINVNFLGCNALLGLVSQNDPLKKGWGGGFEASYFYHKQFIKEDIFKGQNCSCGFADG